MSLKAKPIAGNVILTKAKPALSANAAPPAAVVADQVAPKAYQTGEPLNFRVKPEFKRRFKSTAAHHGLKMNELLVEAFDLWLQEKGRGA